MLNGKTLMLLLGGVVLSGCGPEPSDPQGNNPAELKQEQAIQKENSAQAGDDTVQKRQAEAAQQAAKKAAEYKAKAEAKALADAKAASLADAKAGSLATAEAPQHEMRTRAVASKAFAAQGGNVMGTARYEHYDENPIKQVSQAPLA
ncbi:hypothetical protein KSI10_24040, partial [Salmonella enterica subsp. enterica serovar Indiana]|nr:hypothetical protein [Salmonella enterica subsp. enterica serovar Indiana]